MAIVAGIYKGLAYQRNMGYQKAVNEYTEKLLLAERTARAKEAELNDKIQKATNEATLMDNKITDLSRLVRESSGLRNTIADLRRKLSSNPPTSANKQADTVLDVLGQCQSEYGAVAEAADRHARDVKLLLDAWPK